VNQYNPYAAPHAGDEALESGVADEAHEAILLSLKRTRPWVMFLAILGFLGAAVMVFLGLMMMVTDAGMSALKTGPLGGMAPFFAFIYIVFGGIYLVPSTLLWRYADGIGKYVRSDGSMKALAGAIEKQTSFWRFIGIMTAVLMALYAVGLVAVMFFAMSKAMSH
jgi:succinate dehydrogenase hydrophobic anchor subunit